MKRLLISMAVLLAVGQLIAAQSLLARDFPPLAPQPTPFTVPLPTVRKLANGLKVVVLESHTLPVVTLTLAIRTGAEADPPQLPGTAQFVASMLNEGTRTESAQRIAETLDGMGAVFDSGAEWDNSWATLNVLSNHTQLAFELLSDMIINTAFAPAEVERIRRQTLSALDILHRDPGYLADTLIKKMIFSGTPYSHPAEGVEESVRRLTRRDLEQFHDRYYQPSNAILVVVGDISAAQAFSLAQSSFGAWKGREAMPHAVAKPVFASESRQVIVIDDPNAVQTGIRIANPTISRASPAYNALQVANQVLGGPAENLLFTVLRSRRGLVYGASSDLVCYRNAGAWEIKTSTRTAETIEAVQLILRQMKRLEGHAISPLELQNAQDYLIGHRAIDFETSQQIAQRILQLILYDLPLSTLNQETQDIRSLSAETVLKATRDYLNPQNAIIVLVGDARGFKRGLDDIGQARIIPLADLDLASATLERQPTITASNH